MLESQCVQGVHGASLSHHERAIVRTTARLVILLFALLLWQPFVYFDALFVKSRREGPVQTKAVSLALGITLKGEKELLGLWRGKSAGAKCWRSVFTELKTRGVQDCCVACVDGLTGLPEAVEAVFPKTQVQLCIVHKVRNSLRYVPWEERRAVAADLRAIYGAATLPEAEQALERFAERWDPKYPAISPSWLADWEDRKSVV